jgi:hypothetical protein
LLNATATGQMLMRRATSTSTVVNNTFLADGGEYRMMVDNVPNQPYKAIATSNGSQCAVSLFPNNSVLIEGDAGGYMSPLLIPNINTGVRTSISLHSADQVAREVVNLRVYGQINIFGILINMTISRIALNGPAVATPFDGAPGGTMPLLDPFPGFKEDWFVVGGYNLSYSGQRDFCFIPTGSGLDASNFSTFNINEKYINGVNLTNPSRFPNFIAQNQFQKPVEPAPTTVTAFNSRHISFLARTSQWLFDQMENITPSSGQECSTECSAAGLLALTGNDALCTTANYSVNTPTGTAVIWSVSPAGLVTLSSTGNTATLTRVGQSLGNVTLLAKIGACIVLSKSVQMGLTPPSFTVSEVQKPCPPTTNNGDYIINPVASGVTYAWQCSGCDALSVVGSQGSSAAIIVNNSGSYTFSVVATNTLCATSTYSVDKTFSTGTNCGILRVGVSPNPVKDQLSLSVEDDDDNDSQGKNKSYQVTIADYLGNIKYDAKLSGINAQIDVATLRTGTYSMRIIKGSKIVTKTFSVVK